MPVLVSSVLMSTTVSEIDTSVVLNVGVISICFAMFLVESSVSCLSEFYRAFLYVLQLICNLSCATCLDLASLIATPCSAQF